MYIHYDTLPLLTLHYLRVYPPSGYNKRYGDMLSLPKEGNKDNKLSNLWEFVTVNIPNV